MVGRLSFVPDAGGILRTSTQFETGKKKGGEREREIRNG